MSLEMHFRASRMVRFFNLHSMLPFRIFLDVAIFSSSPMQHLRWSSMWPKKGNSWKPLLTVATESLSLKINFNLVIKYSTQHLHLETLGKKNKQTNKQQNNNNNNSNTGNVSNILKVNNKDTRTSRLLLLLTLNIFHALLLLLLLLYSTKHDTKPCMIFRTGWEWIGTGVKYRTTFFLLFFQVKGEIKSRKKSDRCMLEKCIS